MRYALVLATVVLAACGSPDDRFWSKFEETYCSEYHVCHTGDAPCPFEATYSKPDELACAFDKKMARKCLNGDYVCHDDFGPGVEWLTSPEECREVFVCNVNDTGETGDDDDDTAA